LVPRGHIKDHHRWMLAHLLEEMEFKEGLLTGRKRRSRNGRNQIRQPSHGWRRFLERERGPRGRLLSEIGNKVDAFGPPGQLASWARLAPGNNQSAGQQHYVATLKGNRHIRRLMVQCVWAATRVKDSYLGALFRRVLARRGHPKALVAVANKLIVIALARWASHRAGVSEDPHRRTSICHG
jgi:transposase